MLLDAQIGKIPPVSSVIALMKSETLIDLVW
jgi:hypothetical protein